MALAAMIVLAVLVWGFWFFTHVGSGILFIEPVPFMARIQKLIMANSIDKAIKLCNAAPKSLLPKMVKCLLTRANKPHKLLLVFHEAIAKQDARTPRGRLSWQVSFYSILVASFVAVLTPSEDRATVLIPGVLFLLGTFLLQRMRGRFALKVAENELYTRKVLHLLLERSDYVPPSYKPRPAGGVSPEELAKWREEMEALEERLQGIVTTDDHDQAVDDGDMSSF